VTEEEVYYYGELEKAYGAILVDVETSFEGYRILVFRRGRKTIRVFIDFPAIVG